MAYSSSNLPNIIIVEDSPRLIAVYKRFFGLAGLKIAKIFPSGGELLEFFANSSKDRQNDSSLQNSVILLRNQSSAAVDLETASRLKTIDSRPKIVLVTNDLKSVPAIHHQTFEAILEKPFLMSDLFRTIERVTSSLRNLGGFKIFEGPEEVQNLLKEILVDDISKLCLCVDSKTFFDFLSVTKPYLSKAISDDVQVCLLTDIDADNFQFWKESFPNEDIEIRHINGIKLNFLIADVKHYLTIISSEEKIVQQVMYSNSDSLVSQERLLFESLWRKSIGLRKRLRELEQIPQPEKKLEFFNTNVDYITHRVNIVSGAKKSLDVCYEHEFAQQLRSPALRNAYQSAIRRGVKIRHITEVKSDNVSILTEMIKMRVDVHHLSGVKGGFAVNETNMICTAASDGPMSSETLDFRFPLLIQQAQWMFDSLWKSSTPAQIMINRMYPEKSPFENSVY